MAASRTGVVGVPSDVDVTCVLSFTSVFPTQRRWVMIKTNFQPKIGLKQPNALTQRSQPSIWFEKTTQRFLECRGHSHIAPKNAWKTLGALLSPFFQSARAVALRRHLSLLSNHQLRSPLQEGNFVT